MINPFTRKNTLSLFCLFCSLPFFPTVSFAQWENQASALKPRSELTSVVYDGKIYAFFGFRESDLSEVEPSVEVYDPKTNTWTLLDSVPADKAVTHTGVAVVDDMVWHIGGRVGKNPGPLTSETWIYKISSNTWVQGPALIDPATGDPILWGAGGAALLGRTLHVFGGFINKACNRDQDSYHLTLDVDEWLDNPSKPAKWKNDLAPLPIKRNHFSTIVLGGKIYAIGGQFGHDCGGGEDQNYSHVYDPVTDKWTALPPMPTPRSHTEGSSFALDGKIYLVGGQATNPNSDMVTIFDPAANNGAGAWSDDSTLTLPRIFETLSAKVIDNTFIISHGGQPRYYIPKTATYSRTISRTPVYQLGFYPTCSTLQIAAGQKTTTKTLLFTIDGNKEYEISSNASWLRVTKNATGTAIQTAADIYVTVNAAGLSPGTYYGKITATGTGNGPAYTSAEYCVSLTVTGANTLEAETAVLSKVLVDADHAGYTGTGFANYINNSDDYIEWTINKPTAGSATLRFRYANGGNYNRPLKVEINGSEVSASLDFPSTGDWTNWSDVSITTNLNEGDNKIRLTAIGFSGANIDHLVWSDADAESKIGYSKKQSLASRISTSRNFAISVSPNPTSGAAKLKWNNSSEAPAEIVITDALGGIRKTFLVRNSNAGQFDFSVQDLPSGLYLIFLRQGKEQQSTKLLVGNK